jgi:hypothetical protein
MNFFALNESVVITPTNGRDADGDPIGDGSPITLKALVAPGNSVFQFGTGGDMESADFTVFFPLGTVLPEEFRVSVRGVNGVGRVQKWDVGSTVGGFAVLVSAATGHA